jgi:alpha-tubulin suppressor-like RCC1 family protein
MRLTSGCSRVALAVFLVTACDDDALGPSSTVESVVVIPTAFTMVVGDTLRLTTIARGDIGNPLAGRPVAWETSSSSVATVSATGIVTAVGNGIASITATIEGKTGTAAVTVSPGATFASVATGGAHTCALTTSGAAHCWGRGETGQLGMPSPQTLCLSETYPCALVPFPVPTAPVFTQLTAGSAHTCGLTSDGSAWCWGNNFYGQLGDNSDSTRNRPVAVATTVKFTSIDAGPNHTCALTSAGAAWCWGQNDRGELGDGSRTRRYVPVAVNMPGGVTLQMITAGGTEPGFTCALATGGAAWCWGNNSRGQLGLGTRDFTSHTVPEAVAGSLTFTSVIAGFGDRACALTASGAAHCWGANTNGELGDGKPGDSLLPVAVSGETRSCGWWAVAALRAVTPAA